MFQDWNDRVRSVKKTTYSRWLLPKWLKKFGMTQEFLLYHIIFFSHHLTVLIKDEMYTEVPDQSMEPGSWWKTPPIAPISGMEWLQKWIVTLADSLIQKLQEFWDWCHETQLDWCYISLSFRLNKFVWKKYGYKSFAIFAFQSWMSCSPRFLQNRQVTWKASELWPFLVTPGTRSIGCPIFLGA